MNEPRDRFRFEVLSDGTGMTAEGVARSLASQFPGRSIEIRVTGFLRDWHQLERHLARLPTHASAADTRRVAALPGGFGGAPGGAESQWPEISQLGVPPSGSGMIVATFTDPACRACLERAPWPVLDVLGAHLERLERAFGQPPVGLAGRVHGIGASANERETYARRISAIDFALAHDDGLRPEHWPQADVLVVGVSRSGKTPTSLALALSHGLMVANNPLVDEDWNDPEQRLLRRIEPVIGRALALTIEPERLAEIREGRRPGARYASLAQCRAEMRAVRRWIDAAGVASIDVTRLSIEEIAMRIRARLDADDSTGLDRRP